MAQRPGRVGEAEHFEPCTGRFRGEPQLGARHPGDRLEQRPVEQLGVQPADLAGVLHPVGPERLDGVAGGGRPVAEGVREPAQLIRVVGDGVGAA